MKTTWRLVGLLALALFLGACADHDVRPDPDVALSTQATWPLVQQGDQGQTVKTVQYLLRYRGQSVGTVDGIFGSGTAQAVRNFQSLRGLAVDGIVGSDTWNALIVTLRQGDSGDAVRAVQSELGIGVDGVFGSGTDQAVRNFQASQGLSADGIVGPDTWATLVGGSSGGGSGGDRVSLAQQILGNGNISLWPYSPVSSSSSDGADARSNIRDTANGGPARRSAYGNAPGGSVYLDTAMLQGMLSAAGSYSFRVTSVAGGSHSAGSRHYSGVAFDVDIVNGRGVSSSNPDYQAFMQRCRALGATEVLGPGNAGHSTHIHCAWPR